jgi:pimeloyl-ACP methyl ester carboxylesterase
LSEAGSSSFYRQFAQADEKYTAEVEPLFGKLRCPTKIIWGEDDPWISLDRGRALHRLVGQDHFDILKRCWSSAATRSARCCVKSSFQFS